MELSPSHLSQVFDSIREKKTVPELISLDGHKLTVAALKRIATDPNVKVELTSKAIAEIEKNSTFLEDILDNGDTFIYGLNTGFGGSSNVRSKSAQYNQNSLIRFLNVGFGKTFEPGPVRASMVVKANSLGLAYSGVSPSFTQFLIDIINNNIIPIVPLRGSISASGDLIPMSYIAAAMVGRADMSVYFKGEKMKCKAALEAVKLKPVDLDRRDGLALVNGTSFTAGVSAPVLYDTNIACLLTQAGTALAVEALHGTTESFHPIIHGCMPHCGQKEVADNLRKILQNSNLAVQSLDMDEKETLTTYSIKQDRYSLRSAPQWLGPVVETLKEANRKFLIELNAVSDNPIIDHRTKTVLNGGNFQSETLSLTLDQMRQSIGVCGKLLFAQFEELVNVNLNFDLPPNLSGCDYHVDFGFKGADIAMAAYMSELDHVVNPMSNHVVSAELHNQSVNSLALISCRLTQDALEILQMMLANHLNMLVQAVDLRHLHNMVMEKLRHLKTENGDVNDHINQKMWYELVFHPYEAETGNEPMINGMFEHHFADIAKDLQSLYSDMKEGKCRTEENLGHGTRQLYMFIRRGLGIPFNHGQEPMDKCIESIFDAIKDNKFDDVILDVFPEMNM